jgi:autotransporter-associated beta strand protein
MSGTISMTGGALSLTVNAITLQSTLLTPINSGRYLTLNGAIGGGFGITTSSVGGNSGELFLGGTNTYTGITTISSGYLQVSNASGLGAGDGTPATGTVVNLNCSLNVTNVTIANEHLTIGGGGASGNAAFQSNGVNTVWNGPVVLTADTTMSAITGANGRFNGAISGAFGLYARTATNTAITLAGTNTYSGDTTLEYGNVTILGTAASSAFKGPAGSSDPIRVLVAPGSSIFGFQVGAAPVTQELGVAGATAGLATLLNGLLLNSANGRLSVRVQTAVLADQLAVTGSVNVTGATLAVDSSAFDPAAGTSYAILNNDGGDAIVGTFAGLPEGTIFTANARNYRISFTVAPARHHAHASWARRSSPEVQRRISPKRVSRGRRGSGVRVFVF